MVGSHNKLSSESCLNFVIHKIRVPYPVNI